MCRISVLTLILTAAFLERATASGDEKPECHFYYLTSCSKNPPKWVIDSPHGELSPWAAFLRGHKLCDTCFQEWKKLEMDDTGYVLTAKEIRRRRLTRQQLVDRLPHEKKPVGWKPTDDIARRRF